MAKINPCFKRIFVFFNVLFAIFGIVVLGLGVLLLPHLDKLMSAFQSELSKVTPLNEADEDIRMGIEYVQNQTKCCGLFRGYLDWGDQVPKSCDCGRDEMDRCQKMQEGVYSRGENRMVYSESCVPIMLEYFNYVYDIVLAVLFGFTSLALLGSLMSLGMILRITAYPVSTPSVLPLSPYPPKYSELIASA
ncbi:hypothetical protein NFI96_011665 [Prochilodus magdalenae]|nr:hypothetical protein NFI96_011665 [Prochilodus magdalenae]